MLTKRQMDIFTNMKYEAKLGFEAHKDWDWTLIKNWNEEERKFDFPAIKKQVIVEIDRLDYRLELEIITNEKYDFKLNVLNQIIKMCNERIDSYKEV